MSDIYLENVMKSDEFIARITKFRAWIYNKIIQLFLFISLISSRLYEIPLIIFFIIIIYWYINRGADHIRP